MTFLSFEGLTNYYKMVYGYFRTSGDINPVDSISTQQFIVREFAEEYSLSIRDFLADEKKTGLNQNREAFQRLLYLVENKLVDCILVAHFDRLGRNENELALFLIKLKNRGIECISVTQQKRITLMSETEIAQEAIKAYEENESRTKRIMTSKLASLREGKFIYPPPYGYSKSNGFLIVNEHSEVVKIIFNLFLELESTHQVSNYLNRNALGGVKKWSPSRVHSILLNKRYTGKNYRKIKNGDGGFDYELLSEVPFEAIIDENLFEKVSTLLQRRNTKKGADRQKHFHLFTKVLFCPTCKKALSANILYYYCSNPTCQIRIRKDVVEKPLLEFLQKIEEENPTEIEQAKKSYETRKVFLEEEQKKLEEKYALLKVGKTRFKARMFEIDTEIIRARDELEKFLFLNPSYSSLIEKKDWEELRKVILSEGLKITVIINPNSTFDFRKH